MVVVRLRDVAERRCVYTMAAVCGISPDAHQARASRMFPARTTWQQCAPFTYKPIAGSLYVSQPLRGACLAAKCLPQGVTM